MSINAQSKVDSKLNLLKSIMLQIMIKYKFFGKIAPLVYIQ